MQCGLKSELHIPGIAAGQREYQAITTHPHGQVQRKRMRPEGPRLRAVDQPQGGTGDVAIGRLLHQLPGQHPREAVALERAPVRELRKDHGHTAPDGLPRREAGGRREVQAFSAARRHPAQHMAAVQRDGRACAIGCLHAHDRQTSRETMEVFRHRATR